MLERKPKKQRKVPTNKWACKKCGHEWKAPHNLYSGKCPNCDALVWR